jgi:hypothetical protein
MNIYQQNKNQKPINMTKIDREQQTMKLNLHDSQIQTDSTTTINHNNNNNSKISSQQQQQQKSLVIPTMNSHNTNNNSSLAATQNFPSVFNSNQTLSPSSSSLQQFIPRLSANAVSTTTITNKTSIVTTTKTAIVTNSQATLPHPSTSSTTGSHDIVDLTEEDEDDNTNRVPTQRTAPIRQVNLIYLFFFLICKYFSYQ